MRNRALLLVGHGGVPADYPRHRLLELKRLESQRRASGEAPSEREQELDREIRNWPRTKANDPYAVGIQALRDALAEQSGLEVALAYNEFCAPTIVSAIARLADAGVQQVHVMTSMVTPGGSHAEVEIPEALAEAQAQFPKLSIAYVWPYEPKLVAAMMLQQLSQSSVESGR